MPSAAQIAAELDDLLEVDLFEDPGYNGVQVPREGEVSRLVTGVSANRALLEQAAAAGADMVIVHHGLFWGPGVRSLDGVMYERLRILFDRGTALAAYHLPLDAHPEHGNNVLLAQALGFTPTEQFALEHGQPLGWIADGDAVSLSELAARTETATAREPQLYGAGPERIARVAVVTGSGGQFVAEARAAGAQALVTGEVAERWPAVASELGIHLIAAGHHASERFGVRSIGELLATEHGLSHTFIDVENPV